MSEIGQRYDGESKKWVSVEKVIKGKKLSLPISAASANQA